MKADNQWFGVQDEVELAFEWPPDMGCIMGQLLILITQYRRCGRTSEQSTTELIRGILGREWLPLRMDRLLYPKH